MKTLTIAALALSLTVGQVFAEGMFLRQLPRDDAFRKAADAIGTRLRDEVISTGSFDIGAMHLIGNPQRKLKDSELKKLNLDLAGKIAAMHSDALPKGLAEGTSVKPFSATVVNATGRHLASVYAYSPGSEQDVRLAKTTWVLVGKAGVTPKNGSVVTSRARFWDSSTGTKKYFTQTMFFNADTGRALVLYMISGTM